MFVEQYRAPWQRFTGPRPNPTLIQRLVGKQAATVPCVCQDADMDEQAGTVSDM